MIIVGVYKFLEPSQKLLGPIPRLNDNPSGLGLDVKTKKVFRICNFPEDISAGDEGTTCLYGDAYS